MPRLSLWFLPLVLLALPLQAQSVFTDSFEAAYWLPKDDAEAARFANQATFGATPGDIAALRGSGVENWFTQQAAVPPTLSRPFLESFAVTENIAGNSLDQIHRIQRWFNTAVTAPDQLRQRVAWALGQIVVTSDQDAGLSDEAIMMAEWNDLLLRNAFGNFRTLLREAVRSPMMGRYLTHLRNRKFEITPRCYDQRAPLDDDTTPGTPGLEYHSCTSNDATNNGTMTPSIAKYNLPSSGLVAPDENFAREIMQLFTIGLVERDLDFSPIIDGGTGEPVPTYDQKTVTTLSRVLTGMSYACSGNRIVAGQAINRTCNCTGSDCSFQTSNFFQTPPTLTLNNEDGLVHPDRYEPMICYPRYHDIGRDRTGFLLPGSPPVSPPGATLNLAANQTVPGGTPSPDKVLELGGVPVLTLEENDVGLTPPASTNCDALNTLSPAADKTECLNYCDNEIDAAVDLLFNEPNTATMIARQLIQRLVNSNPSPEYIERVATVFVNNGSSVRGDLRAVVKAVLLDVEARQPPALGNVDAGKPREPLLKLVQLWRSFGAISGDTRADGYRRWANTRTCGSFSFPQCAYAQRPLGAPSVFNFYEPDYAVPGSIAGLNLVSPEFQIINESSSISAGNDIYGQLCNGRGTGNNNNCHAPLRASVPTDSAYFPDAVLDALPGGNCGSTCTASDDATLIEALNVRLLGGTMSGVLGNLASPADTGANTGMKGTLLRLLQLGLTVSPTPTTPLNAGGFVEALPQNVRRREILYLLHLVAISPEYATQR